MKRRVRIFEVSCALILVACSLSAQCQTATAASAKTHVEVVGAVPSPDLSAMDPQVQEQIREAQAETSTNSLNDQQLAKAYGRLGEIYQAYGIEDAAIACYSDARLLQPDEFRWAYYLGYLSQNKSDLPRAISNYEAALRLRPDDEITTNRIAGVHLTLNHLDEAERLYAQELSRNPKSVAALDGLGRVALARRQFPKAIEYLNHALALDPQAAYLHYPLGMAYRGAGDLAKAQEELGKHGPAAPELTDGYLSALQEIKTGKADLWTKASQQMSANNLTDAIATYRKLVEANGQDPAARTYLGTALARAGNSQEAIQQFTEALRIKPNDAETHYCLGVVLATLGNDDQAIEHFRTTIKGDPQFPEVHFQLANVLMRTRHFDEAAAEYKKAADRDPHNAFASVMQAMACIRLGQYKYARAILEQAHTAAPSDFDISNALARVLAAAPDSTVRDGQRALQLMQEIIKNDGSLDSDRAETVAMALAETGQFEKAAGVQRSLIETVEQDTPALQLNVLRETLAHYEHREACRTPWRDDDPIFFPTPQKGAEPPTSQSWTGSPRQQTGRVLIPVVPHLHQVVSGDWRSSVAALEDQC